MPNPSSETTQGSKRILIVDDNEAIHEDFRRILMGKNQGDGFDADDSAFFGDPSETPKEEGFELEFASQGQEALEKVREATRTGQRFAVVFMDVRMPPGWDGIETAQHLWEEDPDLQIVICTAYSDYSWDDMVAKLGTTDKLLILRKPFDVIEAEQAAHAFSKKWDLLQQSRKHSVFLEQTMDLAPSIILWISNQGQVIYANRAAAKALNRSIEDIKSMTSNEIFQTWQDNAWFAIWDKVEKRGGITQETFLSDSQGNSIPIEAIITILDFAKDKVMCVTAHDITDRLATLRELAKARDAALESARMKSQFLANMSHEIRTPMNGVLGMAELLAKSELSSTQKEYVGIINQSGNSLLSIINDILDSSKIESGKLEIQSIPFELDAVVRGTMQTVQPNAAKKGIRICSHLDPNIHNRLVGDPGRLRQVLLNLVGNAVKFTGQGEVSLTVELIDDTPGECNLHFSVKDSGIGIDPSQLKHIFKPFTQADGTDKRSYGGTGLGLTISSQLIQAMGGNLEARSVPDRGSEFHFDLTMPKASAGAVLEEFKPVEGQLRMESLNENQSSERRTPTPESATNPLKILLAEDNPINRKVTMMQLQQFGCIADIAINGQEAVDAANRKKYDIILMDCQMPVMDGYEATREIRKRHPKVRIVALTANAMPEDRQRCLNAGMNDYLSKPLNSESLAAALEFDTQDPQESISANTSATPPQEEKKAVDFNRLREVTGDDADLFREISQQYLEQADEILDDLNKATHVGDHGMACKLAHKLAGSSATCGMQAVVPALRAIEALKPDQISQAISLLKEAERQMTRVRQALQNPE